MFKYQKFYINALFSYLFYLKKSTRYDFMIKLLIYITTYVTYLLKNLYNNYDIAYGIKNVFICQVGITFKYFITFLNIL